MRRVGIGSVIILVLLGTMFGSIAGAVVGAIAASTGTKSPSNTTTVIQPFSSSQSSADGAVVPVTNAEGVVKKVGPAVVEISHTLPAQNNSFDPFSSPQPAGTVIGSGFIVDNKGDIVTNAHVVNGSKNFTITLGNGTTRSGTLVGANVTNDVAVVKIAGPVPAVAQFGNSSTVQLGAPVVAIGDALGTFRNTVTAGIISGEHRSASVLPQTDMLQTDAAINHGNSGGPLIDMTGHVIGINTAIDRSVQGGSNNNLFGSGDPNATVAEGLGFAIPSNVAAPLAAHIINHIPFAHLGVFFNPVPLTKTSSHPAGFLVQKVQAGGPAASAGLKTNDIITSLDGVKLGNSVSLEQAIAPHKPGDTVTLGVWRSGQTLKVQATLTAASNQ